MEEVRIARGSRSQLGKMIRGEFKNSPPVRVGIITDMNVAGIYLKAAVQDLIGEGFQVWSYGLKPGDESKSMESLNEILCAMAREGFNRQDVLVALGGGVPGDITGFAASVYMRGLPYVQVPTTLLAAVDSSMGGKTGINLACGKNMAGTFWAPAFTLTDPEFLMTLPPEIYRDGLAEAVKYGVIGNPNIWDQIRALGNVVPLDPKTIDIEKQGALIESCVELKMKIVSLDRRDLGTRMLLNFGHTVGHAIEQHSNYRISHGEAVAMGMVLESKWTYEIGLTRKDLSPQINEILMEIGFSMDFNSIEGDELYPYMAMDKKHQGETITIVVPQEMGHCDLAEIEEGQLKEFEIYRGLC
jgi:3-dehydroquinate synthase